MEFQTLLESRRSVCAFDGSKSVTEDQIRQLVDAGIQAPSWKNAQTARYYCVLDEAKRADFLKNCLRQQPQKAQTAQLLSLPPSLRTAPVLTAAAHRTTNAETDGDFMTSGSTTRTSC